MGGMTKAVASGMPKLQIEEAAARRQARHRSRRRGDRRRQQVPAHRSPTEVEVLDVDNAAVREAQVARLERTCATAATRRPATAALTALEETARRGDGNLLAAAVDAARARASRGRDLGRDGSAPSAATGPRSRRWPVFTVPPMTATKVSPRSSRKLSAFAKDEGRRPRMMVVKMGQDGHDRGAKVIATAFADIGFDVDVGPLFQTPEEVAQDAIDNDVHVIGVSSQAAGHKTLAPVLIEALKAQGAEEILVVCGGVIPPQDYDFLKSKGVAAIFGPGTNIPEAASDVLALIRAARKPEAAQ